MHINEVSKLKDFGNYQIDVPMSRIIYQIDRWVDEDGLELVPVFQRGRIWKKEQKINFIEFILKGGKCPPLLFNHPGWLKDFKGSFYCVDGLQRISALSDFLNGYLPVFGDHYIEDIEGIRSALKSIHLKIYINDLQTDREVLEWYLELNSGGTPHTQSELDRVKSLLSSCV